MRKQGPFAVGDRVVSVCLPAGVASHSHTVGTGGVVDSLDGDEIYVEFDDGMGWYCDLVDLVHERPLPSVQEAVAGLYEILDTETFEQYIERCAEEFDPIMRFILGHE